jgi:two-component system cell cycle sensor histidine kinase/response regulator CckA
MFPSRDEELENLRSRLAEAARALRALGSGQDASAEHETANAAPLAQATQHDPRSHEQLFRAVFGGTLDALLLANDDGVYVDANPAACELFGLSRERLVGSRLSQFTPPGYEHQAAWRNFLQVGRLRGRFPLLRPDGGLRQLDFSATAHILPGLHLSVLRDVTEQERAEQSLKASEAKFRTVVEKCLGAITLSRGDGGRFHLSPQVARMLGYESEALDRAQSDDLLHPEDRQRLDLLTEELETRPGGSVIVELRARQRDGSQCWLEVTLTNLLADPAVEALVAYFRDVTDRKRTEEALRESRYLLEQAQAVAHVGSWTGGVTPDDPLLYSDECYRIFGLPLGRPTTLESFFLQVHPDDLPRVKEAIRRAELGERYEAEYRICRPDGELRWAHASAIVERRTPDGSPRMIGVVRDVTERQRALEELRASELRYRRIVETASEGIWTIDADYRTTFMNHRMSEMLGYAPEEVLGRSAFDFMDDDARTDAHEVFERLRLGNREQLEFRFKRKDGTDLWSSVQSIPLLDATGCFEGVLGMFTDIAERRSAEETCNRLAAIVESCGDAIIGEDLSGMIVSWNRAAHRLFGYTSEEVLGKSAGMLIPADRQNEAIRLFERSRRGEDVEPFETVRLRKDGSAVPIALTVSPIRDANGRVSGTSGIARDLTDQKRAEAALRRSEEQLRQAQKMDAIGSLAGGVAHDFNNLMSIVVGYTSLLLERLPEEASHREEIGEVLRAGERAVALTRQLLAFSRRQVLQPVVLDLDQVVRGFEQMLRRLLEEDIELALITHAPLGRVAADPSQIEQVIMNLVVNARDAMPRGGTITIEMSNRHLDACQAGQQIDMAPGPYVVLSVTDTGEGIDAAIRERIFEPFFTTKPVGKGTGLGLSTVFGIVRQSGGHVTVESTVGKGTTFRVFLPQCERSIIERASAPAEPKELQGSETVLLVEDDDQVRRLTHTVLRRSGYHVLEAQNSGEALLLSEEYPGRIHLLLTDVIMPRVSGRTLAERLWRARPDMKVLFMSGYADDPVRLKDVLDAGAAFYPKPVVPATLHKKVREVLDA